MGQHGKVLKNVFVRVYWRRCRGKLIRVRESMQSRWPRPSFRPSVLQLAFGF